jgi:peroxiredoxin
MAIGPKEGGRAPNFSMDSTQGPIKLGDYKDQLLVLYFYPKDDTPGCTTEAKDFTAWHTSSKRPARKLWACRATRWQSTRSLQRNMISP